MASHHKAPELERDGWQVTFLDVLLALAIILLVLVHPPKADDDTPPPGQIVVEIAWPADCPADVDLWTKAPGDRPVGYSNRGGKVFNLLRDDLGHVNDASGQNYEHAITRGAPDGEYAVNVHLYAPKGCPLPITVHCRVSLRSQTGAMTRIHEGTAALEHSGQELTLVRFSMRDGQLVPGSIHDIPVALRSGWGSQ